MKKKPKSCLTCGSKKNLSLHDAQKGKSKRYMCKACNSIKWAKHQARVREAAKKAVK